MGNSSSTTDIDNNNTTTLFNQLHNLDSDIITGDFIAHHQTWHLPNNDHRGITIYNIIKNSTHTMINYYNPTRLPLPTHQKQQQQPAWPDLTILPKYLTNTANSTTLKQLSSDHLPLLTTIFIAQKYTKTRKRKTFTNFNKAIGPNFTKWIDNTVRNHTPPIISTKRQN